MGEDKALLEVGGRPMGLIAAQALQDAGADPVLAVGGVGEELGLATVPDRWPGEGPLGGVVTALHATTEPVVAILACDQPFVTGESVRAVVDALGLADVAVPPDAGLNVAIRRSALAVLEERFASGERSLRRALQACEVVVVEGLPEGATDDVDTPCSLLAARRRLGSTRDRHR